MMEELDFQKLFLSYNSAKSRLILLDYDGTIVPFFIRPELTVPDTTTKETVYALASDAKNQVILISGRDEEHLDVFWRDSPIILVAEHGGSSKKPGGGWESFISVNTDWIPNALRAFKALCLQYEGSHTEQKTYSIAWHYRAIANEVSNEDKLKILRVIYSLPMHEQFRVYDGEYTIELRSPGIDKGSFVVQWLGDKRFDFIMAIGDSETDEDLFKVLGKDAWTIKVGKPVQSFANFYLKNQGLVVPFIKRLVSAEQTTVQKMQNQNCHP
ncbi:MAG: trehalose-phosphatase [Bacteroidetes bacterium]|nr:trehalose-phosphatase [Bacteroidota bacterium]